MSHIGGYSVSRTMEQQLGALLQAQLKIQPSMLEMMNRLASVSNGGAEKEKNKKKKTEQLDWRATEMQQFKGGEPAGA